jgi:hypothetical protein
MMHSHSRLGLVITTESPEDWLVTATPNVMFELYGYGWFKITTYLKWATSPSGTAENS